MNCLLIIALAAGFLSVGFAQYAFHQHFIFPDRNVNLGWNDVILYNYISRGPNLDHEWQRQNDRFEFRGTNYSYNCFPLFKEFNQKLPSYGHCNHYYQLIAADNSARYVLFNQCGENEKFDVFSSQCVSSLPDDCVRSVKNCLYDPPLTYIHNVYESLDPKNEYMWLIAVNIDDDIQWYNQDINFYYEGYHYWYSCFPIFITKTPANKIPDPLSCNRYYKYEYSNGNDSNIISHVSCGKGRMFDSNVNSCVSVKGNLPYGCTRHIKSCDRTLTQVYAMNLAPNYNRRSNKIRYEVADVFVEYFYGSYLHNGHLYDFKCMPLLMYKPNLFVPDPSNCHYYYGLDERKKVSRYECTSVDEFFNPETERCQRENFPESCHPEGGCNTDVMFKFNVTEFLVY